MHKLVSRSDAVRRVMASREKSNSSFLLQTIPGGDESSKLLKEIQTKMKRKGGNTTAYAMVSPDRINNEIEFVKKAIHLWCRDNLCLKKQWEENKIEIDDSHELLDEFCFVAEESGIKLCLLIDKFHKVFWYMSNGLLGTMRNAEENKIVSFVTASEADYFKLYSMRAKKNPSFTSDYGQMHAKIILDKLNLEEAKIRWDMCILSEGYSKTFLQELFRIAFSESGGYPALFEKACCLVEDGLLSIDYYHDALRYELRPLFGKMIDHIRHIEGDSFIESLACLATQNNASDVRRVLQSPIFEVLTQLDDNKIRLNCSALGVAALAELNPDSKYGTPRFLYEKGFFEYCTTLQRLTSMDNILHLASKLMCEVYDAFPECKHFKTAVDWNKVIDLSNEGIDSCGTVFDSDDFLSWRELAASFRRSQRDSIVEITAYYQKLFDKELAELSDAVYLLAARYNAARVIQHPTQQSYSAFPLVEGIIKCYLAWIILKLGGKENTVQFVDPVEFNNWKPSHWTNKPPRKVKDLSSLNAAAACHLVAVLSFQKGAAVFSDYSDLQLTLDFMSEMRNPLAHNVVEVTSCEARVLLNHIERLWDKTLGRVYSLSILDIRMLLEPPTSFFC